LAWEAFQAGSISVGAVLVNGTGEVVSSGRNRGNEKPTPRGGLAGSRIAHAEINALGQLPAGDYSAHTLYTTLEPCLLCTAALRLSHVGTVRFAASDPMWVGIERIPELSEQMARRWTRRDGPVGGYLQFWGAFLPLISAVEREVHSVQEYHADAMPELLLVARKWAGSMADWLRGLDLDAAMATVWPDFVSMTEPGDN
jgi:tRNA(adenine34) deaminase